MPRVRSKQIKERENSFMDENANVPQDRLSAYPEIMSLQQVADYLGLHYLTIYRLIQEKKIPAAKIGGSWRFRKDILDKWIKTEMDQRYRNRSSEAA